MSDTPNNADEIRRCLDNGWNVLLYRASGSIYVAVAVTDDELRGGFTFDDVRDERSTDDFTPAQALNRLAEKMIGNII
jgi:hypothetical protein